MNIQKTPWYKRAMAKETLKILEKLHYCLDGCNSQYQQLLCESLENYLEIRQKSLGEITINELLVITQNATNEFNQKREELNA